LTCLVFKTYCQLPTGEDYLEKPGAHSGTVVPTNAKTTLRVATTPHIFHFAVRGI
jgi:hypothetical protein